MHVMPVIFSTCVCVTCRQAAILSPNLARAVCTQVWWRSSDFSSCLEHCSLAAWCQCHGSVLSCSCNIPGFLVRSKQHYYCSNVHLVFTYTDGSRSGRFSPPFVCVCVCLSAWYLKNRCGWDHQMQCMNVFATSPRNLFIFGVKRSKVRVTKILPAWVFALAWVLVFSCCLVGLFFWSYSMLGWESQNRTFEDDWIWSRFLQAGALLSPKQQFQRTEMNSQLVLQTRENYQLASSSSWRFWAYERRYSTSSLVSSGMGDCHQPPRSTQPPILGGMGNEYSQSAVMHCGWELKAGWLTCV